MTEDPHAYARDLYTRFLSKRDDLARLREYARAVALATDGSSKTPVQPLATMGPGGGPLLCDVCGKPMILEGGNYNNVYADEAWRENPQPGWVSYIAGGMVVRVEVNGTLRVFHGYPGRSGCVVEADRLDDEAREAFAKTRGDVSARLDALTAYFRAEHPECDNDAVYSEVLRVMFAYDPGLGVNHP